MLPVGVAKELLCAGANGRLGLRALSECRAEARLFFDSCLLQSCWEWRWRRHWRASSAEYLPGHDPNPTFLKPRERGHRI